MLREEEEGKEKWEGALTWTSVQFNRSVVSSSLWPHGLQHARPPCPSPTPEFSQTHVHWVDDAIQPSHPLSSPSPPAFNLELAKLLILWDSCCFLANTDWLSKPDKGRILHAFFTWACFCEYLGEPNIWPYEAVSWCRRSYRNSSPCLSQSCPNWHLFPKSGLLSSSHSTVLFGDWVPWWWWDWFYDLLKAARYRSGQVTY